jgi:hypothetical protein
MQRLRKPDLRCSIYGRPYSGHSRLLHAQRMLTQQTLACAAPIFWQRSGFFRSDHSEGKCKGIPDHFSSSRGVNISGIKSEFTAKAFKQVEKTGGILRDEYSDIRQNSFIRRRPRKHQPRLNRKRRHIKPLETRAVWISPLPHRQRKAVLCLPYQPRPELTPDD